MEQKNLKVGIVGCGTIAGAHIGGWQACNAQVTALFDTDSKRMESMAGTTGAAPMPSLDALLSSGVDVISITTPPVAHADVAVAALARNIHVLMEKPFALNPAEAQRIMAAASRSEGQVMTAFRHRYLPANRKIKELIEAGELGDVVFFFNRFCGWNDAFARDWHSRKAIAGGGVAMDVASHSVDLFRFFFGDIATRRMVGAAHFAGEVEDSAMIQLQSKSGVMGQIAVGWAAATNSNVVEVVGTKATALYDYEVINRLKIFRRGTPEPEILEFPVTWAFPEQIKAFAEAILARKSPPVTAGDGVLNLQDLTELYTQMA